MSSFAFILALVLSPIAAEAEQRYPDLRSVESNELCNDYFGVSGYHSGFSSVPAENGFCPIEGRAFSIEINDPNTQYQFMIQDRAGNIAAKLVESTPNAAADEMNKTAQQAFRLKKSLRVRYDAFNRTIIGLESF